MRRIVAVAVCLALAWGSVAGPRAAAGQNAPTIQQFLKIRTPGAPVILPDGSLLLRDWPDGVYQLYRSYAPKLGRQLDLSQLPDPARGWVVGMSRFGIAARGMVFCLIGFFLARAAALHDAGEVGGVRESLGALADIGRWPFVVVALGLVAYGLYELVNARYRRIKVPSPGTP